ncbi:uncharacterized protein [Eurosta solidaginis]|uniref:uncharacterized protein n=1 Tax=Eurosta solidaginis TaxID=178769 RepID=UPI003530A338
MSKLTLQNSFFDNIWPLILTENVCDIKSKNVCSFYEPEQLFDNIWLHRYLADRGFKNYQPPTALRCHFDDKEELFLTETSMDSYSEVNVHRPNKSLKNQKEYDSNEEELLCTATKSDIASLEQQTTALQTYFEQRRKLASAFINRQYPWYMQRPEYDTPFNFSDSMRNEFCGKLEQAVIEDIHIFNCKLMIIDLVERICLHVMPNWQKFTRYAYIIVVVRSENAMKQVKLMGPNLDAIMLVENMEYTWQEQLTESLRIAVEHAKLLGEFDSCMKSFVFVFSRARSSSKLDSHRVMRKKV